MFSYCNIENQSSYFAILAITDVMAIAAIRTISISAINNNIFNVASLIDVETIMLTMIIIITTTIMAITVGMVIAVIMAVKTIAAIIFNKAIHIMTIMGITVITTIMANCNHFI